MMRAIGGVPNPNKPLLTVGQPPSGQNRITWALHWAQCGLRLFPCTRFTGLPFIPHWSKSASNKDAQIVEWWSEFPDTDIGAIPDSAGCYVLTATEGEGFDNLELLAGHYSEPLLETIGADGSLHLWLPGRAPSRRLTDGLYVFGVGSYLYMPPSLAPDPVARFDRSEEVA